jgi:pantothenate kinase
MEAQQRKLIEHIWYKYKVQPINRRLLVAIAGAPGSGKTTLSTHLVSVLNALAKESSSLSVLPAISVSMDGYHLYRSQLDALPNPIEAHQRRGAAFTFNVDGYGALISKLRSHSSSEDIEAVWAPSFDHAVKDPIENSIQIKPSHRIVIVEGNYVALSIGKWKDISHMFDVVVFVQVDEETAGRRLVGRHMSAGIVNNETEGWERVRGNDMINGREIAENIVDGPGVDLHVITSVESDSWVHEKV